MQLESMESMMETPCMMQANHREWLDVIMMCILVLGPTNRVVAACNSAIHDLTVSPPD